MKYLTIAAILLANPAYARNGDREETTPRPQTIQCALYFTGEARPQAEASAAVTGGTATLRGDALGVEYVFSVRGKTGVARLTNQDSGATTTAQGAIEMLRKGGRENISPASALLTRRGDDDDQDGNPEREAGFELALAQPGGPASANVKLKCVSMNTRGAQ